MDSSLVVANVDHESVTAVPRVYLQDKIIPSDLHSLHQSTNKKLRQLITQQREAGRIKRGFEFQMTRHMECGLR